jgi:hypothetical protein
LGSSASFFWSNHLAIAKNGNFYVADQNNNRIRMVTPQGLVSTIATCSTPYGIAASSGDVFIGGYTSCRIYRMNADTFAISTLRVNQVTGLSVDPSGLILLISDQTGHLVRQAVISSSFVSTIAGSGSATFTDGIGV